MKRLLAGGACVLMVIRLAGGLSAQTGADDLNEAIRRNRMGMLLIRTRPGGAVRVEQTGHEFWFGAALSSAAFTGGLNAHDQRMYEETFRTNFNAAVTENAVKWPSMEARRGQVNYSVVDRMLAWTEEHKIPLRGHCLFWGIPQYVQDWVKNLDDEELRETIRNRAVTMARRYGGRIAEFDLNNEMLHGNYYEQRLGPAITKQMADWVREGDPDAVLCLNDYDVLTGNQVRQYVAQIRGLLDQGVPIGGIGVQGHLHGESFDARALQSSLDELAQFGLPIRITEFNMPGQRARFPRDRNPQLSPRQEEEKARNLVEYYRICFAHPAVTGILMWGFWEGADWIPQSALWKRDWTPTPAAHAYRDLVFNQWWTRWEGRADANGQCRVPAFYGTHRVTTATGEQVVELKKAEGQATVTFGQ
jgi:endo-1,4-beta-xylanase